MERTTKLNDSQAQAAVKVVSKFSFTVFIYSL